MSVQVCLVGLGEVGAVLAEDLKARGAALSAWDVLFTDTASKPCATARRLDIRIGAHAADALDGADLIISAVTAAQTINAAKDASANLRRDAFYLDLNSASPGAKIEAANLINARGGRYVEAAVMSPIGPKRIASPMLLGGRFAEDATPLLHQLGFAGASIYSKRYGRAAAAKLCRSVIVKGMEALLTEALVTAEHYDVQDTVIASLTDLFPHQDWQKTSLYMMSRAIEHGTRRAEEMREAARTVEEAGLEPVMSAAIAQRQDWAAQFAATLPSDTLSDLLSKMRNDITHGGGHDH